MKKRNWKNFGRKLNEEANFTSGLAAIGTLGLGAAVGVIAAPVVGGTLTVAGFVAIAGTVFYRAIPPTLVSPESKLHETLKDLAELDNLDPQVTKVGFVGTSRAGKTTLLDHLIDRPNAHPNVRTDNLTATISALKGQPTRYYALLDAAGQVYSQQFEVLDVADVLFIFFDNIEGDKGTAINQKRLEEHDTFLNQMLERMKHVKRRPQILVLVLNKRGLWQGKAGGDQIEQWFSDHVAKLKQAMTNLDVKVEQMFHSNKKIEDRTAFVTYLRSVVK